MLIKKAFQCMYGLTTWGKDGKETPARKRTKMMTNCPELIQELDTKCDGSNEHQQLLDGRGKWAARYPENLCRAICKGLMKAIENRRMGGKVSHGDRTPELDKSSPPDLQGGR